MKISMKSPKKWNWTAIWPNYATLGYLFEGIKISIQYFHTHESWGTVHNSWVTEWVLVPVNRGMAKENVESIKRECLFIQAEKWIHAVCKKAGRTEDHHVQWKGSNSDKQESYVLSCGGSRGGKAHKSRTIRGHEDDQREVREKRVEHN